MSTIETYSNLSNREIQQLNANRSSETTSVMQQSANNIKNSSVTMETRPQETSNEMTRALNFADSLEKCLIWERADQLMAQKMEGAPADPENVRKKMEEAATRLTQDDVANLSVEKISELILQKMADAANDEVVAQLIGPDDEVVWWSSDNEAVNERFASNSPDLTEADMDEPPQIPTAVSYLVFPRILSPGILADSGMYPSSEQLKLCSAQLKQAMLDQ